MNKIFKGFFCVAIIVILLLSFLYINAEHRYDLTKIKDVKTDENYIQVSYNTEEKIEDESVLGILAIEKINLKATVKEGSTQKILQNYVGHITETAKFDGNIGLAAHNRLNRYSYFARINELEKGDEIIYKTKFYTRKYKVTKKVVIYDTDWSYLEKTKDNRITMITCIQDKSNQRLCVQAVEYKEDK